MNQIKRYEILDHLPAYGPMYISVAQNDEIFASEGFVVRFHKTDGSSWVANFKPGYTQLNCVFELKNSPYLLIVAKGECYLMNPEESKPVSVFGTNCYTVHTLPDGRIVLQRSCDLIVVEPDGSYWYTEGISIDGMDNVKIMGNIITGDAYYPTDTDEEWRAFSYNIDRKILSGGSYTGNSSSKENSIKFPKWVRVIFQILIGYFVIKVLIHLLNH